MTGPLTTVDPGPLPPSVREMQDALLAFHTEFYSVGPTEHPGTPADLVLLQLAERLLACRAGWAETRVAGRQAVLGGEGDC